jgi:hypothetical protein
MIKQIVSFSFFIIVIAGLLGGCAVGQKYNYSAVVSDLSASGNKTLGVATHDQRPYILSGEKKLDYVGTLRGGYGNPFNVATESGQPLADDMTQSISSSLSKKGFKPLPVVALPNDSFESILGKLKATQGDNLILLTLYQWRSDVNKSGAFIWDPWKAWLNYYATIKVFNNNGGILTEKKIGGSYDLGNSFEFVGHSTEAVPKAFKVIIEELLNAPEVVKSLQQ